MGENVLNLTLGLLYFSRYCHSFGFHCLVLSGELVCNITSETGL